MTPVEYRHNYIALFGVFILALIIAAFGGKYAKFGVWMVAILLFGFGLHQATYYSQHGRFDIQQVG